ncbi:DUF5320 domain-containing protein [Geotalea uraniireducens]|uniref:DUF5320 domain-containing protein n=1 Tax=Geotalea uraniireducens TaxID=351604 RepID=UPI0032B5883C
MPGGDRTGPQGLGPRSGGARGRCTGGDAPGDGGRRGGQAGTASSCRMQNSPVNGRKEHHGSIRKTEKCRDETES